MGFEEGHWLLNYAASSSSLATVDDNSSVQRAANPIERIEHNTNDQVHQFVSSEEDNVETETDADAVPKTGCSHGEQKVPEKGNIRKQVVSCKEAADCMTIADQYEKMPEHVQLFLKNVIRERDSKRRKLKEENLNRKLKELAQKEERGEHSEPSEPSSDD